MKLYKTLILSVLLIGVFSSCSNHRTEWVASSINVGADAYVSIHGQYETGMVLNRRDFTNVRITEELRDIRFLNAWIVLGNLVPMDRIDRLVMEVNGRPVYEINRPLNSGPDGRIILDDPLINDMLRDITFDIYQGRSIDLAFWGNARMANGEEGPIQIDVVINTDLLVRD